MNQAPELSITPFKGSGLVLKGTIEAAKQWLDGAALFEAGKLYCQVMAGFELAVLWKQAGIANGGDRKSQDSKSVSQNGKLISHNDVCEALGESKSQVYRYMAMAKVCAKRLKRMPELSDFNPLITPIAALPAPKIEALKAAIHKLTDNQTQKDFCEKHGLWKKPPGNPNAKGAGQTKEPQSTEDEAAILRRLALEDSGRMGKAILVSNKNFFALTSVSDVEVQSQIAVLEHALKLRRLWVEAPKSKRDPAILEPLLKASPLK